MKREGEGIFVGLKMRTGEGVGRGGLRGWDRCGARVGGRGSGRLSMALESLFFVGCHSTKQLLHFLPRPPLNSGDIAYPISTSKETQER